MTLLYTTVEEIARRLQGRLNINGSASIGTQTVDPLLIEQMATRVEDYINLHLAQVYELPLQREHPILADIEECLVISRLMEVHFQGSSFPTAGADVSGTAGDLRKNGESLLLMLTVGVGLYSGVFPGGQQNVPNLPQGQPLVLPGEVLRVRQPDIITRNVTVVASRNLQGTGTRLDWGDMSWLQGRARGSERLWDGRMQS